MSVERVFRRPALDLVRDACENVRERERRRKMFVRARLLADDGDGVLREELRFIFTDPEVRRRINAFARLTNSQGLFKRVVNEQARPVYSVPPIRTLTDPSQQETFHELSRECRLDARMDLAARIALAANDALLYTRFVQRLNRVVIDVIHPSSVTVIEDPDDPTIALGYIYDKRVGDKTWRVFWDDEIRFQVDENYRIVPIEAGRPGVERHGLSRVPFVHVKLTERAGTFFDGTSGDDLVAAHLQCALLNLLALRNLKTRGFSKLVLIGDLTNIGKDQIFDEESALALPDGATIQNLSDKSDSAHYLAMLDAIKTDAAANRGISRARMNQDNASASSDVGLRETRAELIRVMTTAELEQFEVLKIVSAEHPRLALAPDCKMHIDYGELQHRVDRETQLRIRDAEEKQGVANVLDWIREDNPEVQSDEEAWAEFDRNIVTYARKVESIRALNVPADANVWSPGMSPREAGALGSAVRDGHMSAGEAKDMVAESRDYRAIAKRLMESIQ